eukprot:TRINITY_DN12269_c1_g1_i4.p1 TRINITY_DN12269_c1_g1~~TRINITY_DN12269_c1_g1_i4.p1  ORF type:complete len:237 (+),score=47.11 TRINITY_DN12269_c1_g1_i4:396-1106(+)
MNLDVPWTSRSCQHCHRFYKSETSYKKHLDIEGHGCIYYCSLCDQTFSHTKLRKDHNESAKHQLAAMQLEAQQQQQQQQQDTSNASLHDGQDFQCEVCHLRFTSFDEYNLHVDNGTMFCKSTCRHCLRVFEGETQCHNHEATCPDNPKRANEHKLECHHCHTTFATEHQLFKHQRSLAGCRFRCRHCHAVFRSEIEPKTHGREKCEAAPSSRPTCQVCKTTRAFSTQRELDLQVPQ